MDKKTITTIAIVLVVLGAGYAVARPAGNALWNGVMGHGPGMMSNYGQGNGFWGGMMGQGSGMMANYGQGYGSGGGMMGSGYGCGMAGYGYTGSGNGVTSDPISIEAKGSLEKYIEGNPDLEISEIMEFQYNFYAEIEEESTGIHAFELLVNKYTGAITPEMGPNMMWNTKYGHMNQGIEAENTITGEQAIEYAQEYLDRVMPGQKADDAHAFYGYYTLHVLEDDKIYGMLSVHGQTGAVWYHNWHGEFIEMLEVH